MSRIFLWIGETEVSLISKNNINGRLVHPDPSVTLWLVLDPKLYWQWHSVNGILEEKNKSVCVDFLKLNRLFLGMYHSV